MHDNPYRAEEGEVIERRGPRHRLLGWISLASFLVGSATCILSQLITMPHELISDPVGIGDTFLLLRIDANSLAFLIGLTIIAISFVIASLWAILIRH